jgi:hypothetical protein
MGILTLSNGFIQGILLWPFVVVEIILFVCYQSNVLETNCTECAAGKYGDTIGLGRPTCSGMLLLSYRTI